MSFLGMVTLFWNLSSKRYLYCPERLLSKYFGLTWILGVVCLIYFNLLSVKKLGAFYVGPVDLFSCQSHLFRKKQQLFSLILLVIFLSCCYWYQLRLLAHVMSWKTATPFCSPFHQVVGIRMLRSGGGKREHVYGD